MSRAKAEAAPVELAPDWWHPPAEPQPLIFGDPESIARRGPVKLRKLRVKLKSSKKWKRYQPIWQRIEGEWKRMKCRDCGSLAFRVIEQKDALVYVRCAAGHEGVCLAGFQMEKPE